MNRTRILFLNLCLVKKTLTKVTKILKQNLNLIYSTNQRCPESFTRCVACSAHKNKADIHDRDHINFFLKNKKDHEHYNKIRPYHYTPKPTGIPTDH